MKFIGILVFRSNTAYLFEEARFVFHIAGSSEFHQLETCEVLRYLIWNVNGSATGFPTSQTSFAVAWHSLKLWASNFADCIGIPWRMISLKQIKKQLVETTTFCIGTRSLQSSRPNVFKMHVFFHTTYTSTCCFPIPNALFWPCSVLLSETRPWQKGQHFGLADSRCWAEDGQRSMEVSRKAFSSLIESI